MDNNVKKGCECNRTVKCDVTNCVYHSTSDYCEAKEIKVGPGFAASYKDTACNTFVQKD
ncbi:MAG: DUF1540 domain-containing protein [Oscillospiraceae bacterium]